MKWNCIVGLLGIALIGLTNITTSKSQFSSARFDFVAPPMHIDKFSFGYNENMADSLWLRVIQDISVCEKVPDGNAHSEERVLARQSGRLSDHAACGKGWVFQMLDAITTLAPKFEMAYIAGGSSLSILVDDREGAAIIYERGVKQFPKDWTIAYRAGYHFLAEVKDPERASRYLLQAARNGAPHWVYALAGRLQDERGKALLAKSIYEEALARDPEGTGSLWIKKKLADLDKVLESTDANKAGSTEPPNRADTQAPQPAQDLSKVPQFLRKTN